MLRPLRPSQLAVDIMIAVVLLLFSLPPDLGLLYSAWPTAAGGSIVALPVVVVMCAGLALRRVSPPLALASVWVGAIVQMALGLSPMFSNIAIFGVLYATAAYGSRLVLWLGFGSALVGAATISVYLVVPPLLRGGWSIGDAVSQYLFVGLAAWVAATFALLLAWTVGALVRTAIRARQNREAQERAQADAVAEQERVRIARDMHDVVAHSLAVVIAQADGARYAAASDPASATAALSTISTTARSALADVRLLLTQLRHSQAEGPQPTLADLEALYSQVRASGVPLSVDVDPAPHGEPPAALQLAVYRILQEALTNALRHGDGGAVSVRLSWWPDRVELAVRNGLGARDAASSAPGHGLIGMRERAQLVGGRVDAGRDGDAFVVAAVLPAGVPA